MVVQPTGVEGGWSSSPCGSPMIALTPVSEGSVSSRLLHNPQGIPRSLLSLSLWLDLSIVV